MGHPQPRRLRSAAVCRELGDACILHYTWGPIVYNKTNQVVWEFDKRTYGGGQYMPGPRKLEKLPLPPPWEPGMHLQVAALGATTTGGDGRAMHQA